MQSTKRRLTGSETTKEGGYRRKAGMSHEYPHWYVLLSVGVMRYLHLDSNNNSEEG